MKIRGGGYTLNLDSYLQGYQVDIYSINKEYMDSYELLFNTPIIGIDAGCSEASNGWKADKVFQDTNGEEISYGYLEGDSQVNSIQKESKVPGKEFLTNRFSPNSFTYRFNGIPQNKKIKLFVDIMEHWYDEPNKRVFDIKVTTDNSSFILEDIDIYEISVNHKLGKKSPVRIGIEIPKTRQVDITFISKDTYDMAMIHGIGLLESAEE